MKYNVFILANLLFCLVLSSCMRFPSSLVDNVDHIEQTSITKTDRPYTTLMDALRDDSRLIVTGGTIELRDWDILQYESGPFFYIDDFPLGTDFRQLEQSLVASNIRAVDVITDPTDLEGYGDTGKSGIIKIITK